jgi:hypothetical protein
VSNYNIAMSFLVLPDSVPYLKEDASNWATFAARFREAMRAMYQWGHFDGTHTCPTLKDAANPTSSERQAITEWKRDNGAERGLLSPRFPDCILIRLIDQKTAKGQWDRLIEELGQPALDESGKEKGLTRGPSPQLQDGGVAAKEG